LICCRESCSTGREGEVVQRDFANASVFSRRFRLRRLIHYLSASLNTLEPRSCMQVTIAGVLPSGVLECCNDYFFCCCETYAGLQSPIAVLAAPSDGVEKFIPILKARNDVCLSDSDSISTSAASG
jgi:hypothetical protein